MGSAARFGSGCTPYRHIPSNGTSFLDTPPVLSLQSTGHLGVLLVLPNIPQLVTVSLESNVCLAIRRQVVEPTGHLIVDAVTEFISAPLDAALFHDVCDELIRRGTQRTNVDYGFLIQY